MGSTIPAEASDSLAAVEPILFVTRYLVIEPTRLVGENWFYHSHTTPLTQVLWKTETNFIRGIIQEVVPIFME